MPGTAQRGKAAPSVDEARLARAAAAGDGRAFAELYERYEKRAYNLAYRITGAEPDAADATEQAFLETMMRRQPTPQDDQPAFAAQLFGATRDACHDLMEKRQPGRPDEATPRNSQDEVREANLRLPARQREALALRELEGLSYGGIAALMAIAPDAVAKLIYRGRVNLSDELHGTGLAAVGAPSPECERALPLIAAREDGQLEAGSDDGAWLDSHLSGCERCTLGVEEMRRAAESYRAWAPIAALPWMLEETMAKAASLGRRRLERGDRRGHRLPTRPRLEGRHGAGRPGRRRRAPALAPSRRDRRGRSRRAAARERHRRRAGRRRAVAGLPAAGRRVEGGGWLARSQTRPETAEGEARARRDRADGDGAAGDRGRPAAATDRRRWRHPGRRRRGERAGGGARSPGVPGIEPPQAAAAPKAKPTPTPQPASAPAPAPVEAQPPPQPPVEEPVPEHPSKGKGPPPGVPKGGP